MIGPLYLLVASTAGASGCMWYVKYELGTKIGMKDVRGEFKCSEFPANVYNYCRFIPEDHTAHFTTYPVLSENVAQNAPNTIQAASFEAMRWEDCDGGDPVPEYQKNGIYENFTYNGFIFERFFDDKL